MLALVSVARARCRAEPPIGIELSALIAATDGSDDPTRWILFEVYTDRAAHAAHRQSPHFMAYNDVAERAVVEKSVAWAVDKHVTA